MNLKLLLATDEVIEIELEEYLRAVVPAEMFSHWHLEALRAQAVAARSYAVYAIKHPRHAGEGPNGEDVHLCQPKDGYAHCQAYDPAKIHPKTDQAIRETAGVVMVYGGEIVDALFHSNCGGRTLGNDEVFRSAPIPYLRGVKCPKGGKKYGHGVGMCQYGAQLLALAGRSWKDILNHYYSVVEFCRLDALI